MYLTSLFGFLKKDLKKKAKITKWPSKKQWVQVFKVLNKKERAVFLFFIVLFLGSSLFLVVNFYLKNTETAPAKGGNYIEGVVGNPRFINPIYAQSSDVDRDLVEVIFSSLVPDLAETVEIKDGGETYEIHLKENVFWHDNEKLTADDVIFTIKTIQNPDYKSPLRANYLGVEVEKINDYTLKLKLNNQYSAFQERLDLKILPKHIWQDISPQNFLLTNYNLQPIGSGPYKFKALKQDGSNSVVSLELAGFKNYFEKDKPYLSKISFYFFKSEEDLIKAAKKGEVDGFSINSPENFDIFKKSQFNELSLSLPRYFAIFFNPDKSRFLANDNIRKALNYATNKEKIVEDVLHNRAEIVDSPVLPEVYGYEAPTEIYEFSATKTENLFSQANLEKKEGKWVEVKKETIIEFKSDLKTGSQGKEVTALQTCLARDPEVYPEGKITGYFGNQTKAAVIAFQEKYKKDILDPWGFSKGTGTVSKTTRTKLNEICSTPPKETPLKFSLITVQDPVLEKVALEIKKQWAELGIEVEIQSYPISQLTQDFIKPRNYEMLLFGEVLGQIPDPFPFWHSSQIKDPGLNLAKYDNSKADILLETARVSQDEQIRAEKYNQLQNIIIADSPSVFLYQPQYIYFINKKIKGGIEPVIISDPSKRFSDIQNWHTNQKRTWR
ncbi:MAG: peptide ABC transporter substrate-binding protein [Candidatus Nealsonbacteria bacterium]|nr:peptide ABC transporter substrate-binding protein [Candidatus Nealsonbacteria bacterium]